jgi:hypothetical protein
MRFVADDGTEFSTEKECLEYENNVNDIKKCFILYGDNLNELTEDSFDSLCYLHILEKPEEVVTYLYNQYGFGFNTKAITEIGIYVYDDFGMWRNVDNLITSHIDKAKSLKEIATKITKLSLNKIKEDL